MFVELMEFRDIYIDTFNNRDYPFWIRKIWIKNKMKKVLKLYKKYLNRVYNKDMLIDFTRFYYQTVNIVDHSFNYLNLKNTIKKAIINGDSLIMILDTLTDNEKIIFDMKEDTVEYYYNKKKDIHSYSFSATYHKSYRFFDDDSPYNIFRERFNDLAYKYIEYYLKTYAFEEDKGDRNEHIVTSTNKTSR